MSELKLMRPQPVGLAARNELQARPEILQDQRNLRDHELAGLEKRRRVRRTLPAVHHPAHGIHAGAAPPRDIDIARPRLLQRQADKLAAPLNFRPVVKLVAHRLPPLQDGTNSSAGPRGHLLGLHGGRPPDVRVSQPCPVHIPAARRNAGVLTIGIPPRSSPPAS